MDAETEPAVRYVAVPGHAFDTYSVFDRVERADVKITGMEYTWRGSKAEANERAERLNREGRH